MSVSIRIFKLALGESTFARFSFRVLQATPLPKTGKDTRVFAVTSQIFCAAVACAIVGADSINTAFPIERASPAGISEFVMLHTPLIPHRELNRTTLFATPEALVSSLVTYLFVALGVPLVPPNASCCFLVSLIEN